MDERQKRAAVLKGRAIFHALRVKIPRGPKNFAPGAKLLRGLSGAADGRSGFWAPAAWSGAFWDGGLPPGQQWCNVTGERKNPSVLRSRDICRGMIKTGMRSAGNRNSLAG